MSTFICVDSGGARCRLDLMTPEELQVETRSILKSSGALISDSHFVYASDHHGAGWIAKD